MSEPPVNDNPTNVVDFPGATCLPIPVDKVLECAKNAELDDVIVIGQDKEGRYYVSSSTNDVLYINWVLDIVKAGLLAGDPFVEGPFILGTPGRPSPPPKNAG